MAFNPEKVSSLKIVGDGIWQIERGGSKGLRVWWIDKAKGSVWHKVGEFETWDEAVKRTEQPVE